MFTGLIEEKGTIAGISRSADSCVLTIKSSNVLEGSEVGDSIAVNGVCLTVTSIANGCFTADMMMETLRRSSLGSLVAGSSVNLERAMPADGRFGGHIVSGHIDGTGTIRSVVQEGNAVWYTINASPPLLRFIVEKGSIAIDGISLTVAFVDESCFKVSIIPHTMEMTTLPERKAGDVVNLECDIIGKYVDKLMSCPVVGNEAAGESSGGLTEEFLRANGFYIKEL
ncbi:MAG: riboflavin synthase, partial [Clostridiales bacterium]|nr:riboflavin synthase [Clostridiales bacterium]